MKPQCEAILALLREKPEGITALDALDRCGSFRLGARVWDLRAEGFVVDAELVTLPNGKRVARYRLIENEQATLGLPI